MTTLSVTVAKFSLLKFSIILIVQIKKEKKKKKSKTSRFRIAWGWNVCVIFPQKIILFFIYFIIHNNTQNLS